MLIVVEGTALPCHKQVMAVHSKVFAGMADLTARLGHGAHASAKIHRSIAPCVHRILELQKATSCCTVSDAAVLLSSRKPPAHGGAIQG